MAIDKDLDYIIKTVGTESYQRLKKNNSFSDKEIADGIRAITARGEPAVLQETIQEAIPEFFDGKKFLHNVMGDFLIGHCGVCKINDCVHIYDGGIYRQGEERLHGIMVELLPTISDAKRREVFKYIKVSRQTEVKELSPPHLIPFRHRIYNLITGEFLDYSPEYVFLNRFPWDYFPDAPECRTVTDTINGIASGDAGVIHLLLEAFGNCFYLLNSYRGAVLLYGPNGSNGKSTLLNMLCQLIGPENASFLSLQDTAQKFRLIDVYGKAVNIGDDISDAYFTDSSIFKRLVTGEMVMAEKKGQDPVSFLPFAKMFFAMNTIPPVSDKSKALFSRLLLVPLNNDFSSAGKRDIDLKARKWSQEEMEYLVRLSMDGLRRLIRQGDFTRPACVLQAMREFEIENNPVIGFLTEYEDPVDMPTAVVYSDFQDWCRANGHKNIFTNSKFSREVCRQYNLAIRPKRTSYFDGALKKCFVKP